MVIQTNARRRLEDAVPYTEVRRDTRFVLRLRDPARRLSPVEKSAMRRSSVQFAQLRTIIRMMLGCLHE